MSQRKRIIIKTYLTVVVILWIENVDIHKMGGKKREDDVTYKLKSMKEMITNG